MKIKNLFQKRFSTASYTRVLIAVSLCSVLLAGIFSLFHISILRAGSVGQYAMTDYWETIRFALSENPYGEELHSSYAPMAFWIVYPFALICKDVAFSLSAAECVSTWQFQLSFWSFFLVCASLCVFLMARFASGNCKPSKRAIGVTACVFLCSAPVYFSVVRANVIIAALVLLLLYLNFYESERPALRLLSYGCLAVAATIKFYTLVFGVLLIRKARLQDCLKVFVFVLLAFFLPFLSYGAEGFSDWFSHFQAFLGETGTSVRFHNVSCVQLVIATLDKLSKWFSFPLGNWAQILLVALQVMVGILFVFCSVFTKSDKKAFGLITLFCCIIANPSYFYIAIFLYPLLFVKLKEEEISFPLAVFYLIMASSLTLVKWWAAIPHCVLLTIYALFMIITTLREIVFTYTSSSFLSHVKKLLSGFRYNGFLSEVNKNNKNKKEDV